MRVLLDTHACLWFLSADQRLSPLSNALIGNAATTVLVSVATLWEAAIKHGLGKLQLDAPPAEFFPREFEKNDFSILPVEPVHVYRAGTLQNPGHRDPFDRLLIAQALEEGLAIVSNETAFDAYGVQRLW